MKLVTTNDHAPRTNYPLYWPAVFLFAAHRHSNPLLSLCLIFTLYAPPHQHCYLCPHACHISALSPLSLGGVSTASHISMVSEK